MLKFGLYEIKVHRSLTIQLKDGVQNPATADDYVVSLETLDGLIPEIIDGI